MVDLRPLVHGSDEERGDILKAYTASKGNMADVINRVMLATDGILLTVMLCCCTDDMDRFREVITAAIAASEVQSYAAFTKVRASLPASDLQAALKQCSVLLHSEACIMRTCYFMAGATEKGKKAAKKRTGIAAKEAAEAEELVAAMRAQAEAHNGGNSSSSSSSSKRQVTKGAQHFDSMINALAARYGADDSEPPELPDAAFEPRAGPKKGAKAAASLNSNSKKRATGDSPPDGDILDDEFEALRAQMAARKAARDSASSGSGSGSSSTAKSTSKRRK
eukprot:19027-Heterococcus_DN1.PRE.1